MRRFDNLAFLLTQPVALLGGGVSGLAVLRFLYERGARQISVRDRAPFLSLSAEMQRYAGLPGVTFQCGEDYLRRLNEPVIFRTPGIRPDLPALIDARGRGAVVLGEVGLFCELTPATLLAVTGSDGKTTTATLTAALLRAESERRAADGETPFRVFLGGNIGQPLLSRLPEMSPGDYAVLELSSFQLMDLSCAPLRAALLNVTPNHLNWHTDMTEYAAAKRRVLERAQRGVLNADNPYTADWAREGDTLFSLTQSPRELRERFGAAHDFVCLTGGHVCLVKGQTTTPLLSADGLRLPGRHNLANLMAAVGLCDGPVAPTVFADVAASFQGVPHRLEYVGQIGGVHCYNSSIDTTPARTAAALDALPCRPVVLCGGSDKGVSYEPLADALLRRAGGVVLTGHTARAIEAALTAHPLYERERLPMERVADFVQAVRTAHRMAGTGGTLLLSPACASFDTFTDYGARGDAFRQILLEMR